MHILTVDQLYEEYPKKKFYRIFYTDKQIENFKSGLNENDNGIKFTGKLGDTIMFPYGLSEKLCGEIFPKWICEVYFTDEASDAIIYIDNINNYKEYGYKSDDNIDYDNLNNYGLIKCNKCILSELIKFDPFLHPHKTNNQCGYIKGNGNLLQFVETDLQTIEMCKLAVQNKPAALKYVKPEFRANIEQYLKEYLEELEKNKSDDDYSDDDDN